VSELRAVLLTTDYPPRSGGIARLLGELVGGAKHSVDWQVLDTRAEPTRRGNRKLARRLEGSVSMLRATRWLRAGDDRLVVCGHPYLAAPAVLMARMANAPLGSLAYGMELVPRRPAHHAALRALRRSDRVVAISRHTARCVLSLGVSEDRVRVVPPRFRPSWAGRFPPRCRSEGAGLRVVAITRLSEGYKNIELLLQATRVLGPAGVIERTTIVGGGPRLEALRERARAFGVDEWFELTGHVDEDQLGTLVGSSHVGVFPSRESIAERGFEGFGLAVVELGAAGMPVLVADAAGAVDAAEPEWSMLLDPDDLRAWVRALEALAADESRRMAMAEAAFAWAAALDSRGTAQQLLDALRSR
jgi:glycosyltransferase involved in cell wall biosynthesis